MPKRQKAIECGYYTVTQDDSVRANLQPFMEALLTATGLQIDQEASQERRGRELTFRAKVNKNGQIIVGSAYTKMMGLESGDVFEVKLGSKHIHLIQLAPGSLADDEDEEDEVDMAA